VGSLEQARGGTRVLVIDDDPIALQVARERLESAGHEVLTREEALGAAQAVRDLAPELVLVDVLMPALGGEQIAALLGQSRLTRDIGVILYSSLPEDELDALVAASNALGAIRKTGDEAVFLRQFEDLLRRHREAGSRARGA
jgi:CheY-like chemotaxis protein